jgi:hypothetical protein
MEKQVRNKLFQKPIIKSKSPIKHNEVTDVFDGMLLENTGDYNQPLRVEGESLNMLHTPLEFFLKIQKKENIPGKRHRKTYQLPLKKDQQSPV